MPRTWLAALTLLLACSVAVQAVPPAVSNVCASQRLNTELVDIYYDLSDPDSSSLSVAVQVLVNGGAGYDLPATSLSGTGYGLNVSRGSNKKITWDARADWDGRSSANVRFRVTASERSAPVGMVQIPAGIFTMGYNGGAGLHDEEPEHPVYVSAFYMARTEVTNDKMVEVMQWAYENGLIEVNASEVFNLNFSEYLPPPHTYRGKKLLNLWSSECRITWNGSQFGVKAAKGSGYPCVEVTWYGAVAFCNYRSQMEGLRPCYDLSNWSCDWSANGYRLPTEAEWEKAARGGLDGELFPWGDAWIDYSRANYRAHPDYDEGGRPFTSPVGSFAPTGYLPGLYDMAGNVWEWCWDLGGFYTSGYQVDPRYPGVISGGDVYIQRGGGWVGDGDLCRVAARFWFWSAEDESWHDLGFRCARSAEDATGNAQSNLTTVDTRNSPNDGWRVRAWADKDGDDEYDAGEGLADADVYYSGRTNRLGQTTADGMLQISKAPKKGNTVFIRKAIYHEPAVKDYHGAVDNLMFTLWLDSDVGATDSEVSNGTWNDYTLTSDDVTDAYGGDPVYVQLAHPIFEWNLVVATDVASASFHQKLRTGFTNASHRLFDVTDGQMKFGKIAIYENVGKRSDSWKGADMVIYAKSDYEPHAGRAVPGMWSSQKGLLARRMFFGTDWTGWDYPGSAHQPHFPDDWQYYQTIVHEFGHYALGLYDEYKNGLYLRKDWKAYREAHPGEAPGMGSYGLMDSQYGGSGSEMSSYNDYLQTYQLLPPPTPAFAIARMLALRRISLQVANRELIAGPDWYPCWQWVEHNFEQTYSGIPIEIVVPPPGHFAGQGTGGSTSEDRSGPDKIPAPYVPCEFPSTTSGSMALGAQTESHSAPETERKRIQVLVDGVSVGGVLVTRHRRGEGRVSVLGVSDKRGEVFAYGVGLGDLLAASHDGQKGQVTVAGPDASGPIQIHIGGQVKAAGGNGGGGEDLGVLVWAGASPVPTNWLALQLSADAALSGAPTVTVHPDDGAGEIVSMLMVSPSNYNGTLNSGDAVGGTVELSCQAVGGGSVASTDQFALGGITPTNHATVYSRDGWVDLNLPAGSVATNALAVIYAGYAPPIMPAGFAKEKVGPVYCLSLGGSTNLNGQTASVNISYRESDLARVDETTVQLHRWNEALTVWDLVDSGISPDQNVLSATLTNLGIFALFADSTSDIAPPGTISDLTAAAGTNGWTVNVGWTATGDDEGTGTATSYILKFSEGEITSNNWNSAATMNVGLSPSEAGTPESTLLQMPDPGVTYFFALRAQDEAGNVGPMSNVATTSSHAYDTDGDGMMDQWEATYSLSPTNSADADFDKDGDDLTNSQEYEQGTSPTVWDSDGDGMSDGWEVEHGLNPRSAADGELDPDQDDISNVAEYQRGSDPLKFDALQIGPSSIDPDGAFRMTMFGMVGRTYTLEVSTNLPVWSVETQISFTNNAHVFTDISATNAPHQFYRLRE